jgi:crossover junction endodeoxyribonuclease RuvC
LIIIGIDPGTATTGIGIIKKTNRQLECLYYQVITTAKTLTPEKRLQQLYNELKKIIQKYQPNLMVTEKLFFFKNLKTVMPVSEARGIILLLSAQKKIKLLQITPLQVKTMVCGYGRAEKKQVQRMVQKILTLEALPKPDDAADGLALAICGAYQAK